LPELHARGVVLVAELLEAADHIARYRSDDVAALLRETAEVLGDLLKRDIPAKRTVE
jgi:NTP pyrophosphatase (non-canonical NTP hydrolase)